MSLISFTPLADGVTGVNAAATNTPLNTIFNDYNGNITDANIASNAAIAYSKLAVPLALGYAEVSANQTSITTVVDLTSLSVTVTVPTGGRRIKITGYARVGNSSSDVINNIYIFEGSTQLQAGSALTRSNSGSATITAIWSGTPTSGSHTYKLRADTGGGSMSVFASATATAFILAEAI